MKKILTPVAMLMGGLLAGCTGTLLMNTGYNVRGGKVYYKNPFPGTTFEVTGVDVSTFRIIPDNSGEAGNSSLFAVDKANVYYGGYRIAGSDGKTFTLLDGAFAKDKNQCYYRNEIIPGADPATFRIMSGDFSADKHNIYKNTALLDSDNSIFETFDSSAIIHTANTVCMFGSVVPVPAGAKFTFIKYNYYAIDEQVYFHDTPLEDAVPDNFTPINDFTAVTPSHVFYREKIIDQADPVSYRVLDAPYGKDKKHVFIFERMIEGANPAKFQILNVKFQCSSDGVWFYHEDKRIRKVAAGELDSARQCTQCNETNIYFSE